MKILVTGAGGQVGLDLLRVLHNRGDEVHASDVALPTLPASPGTLPASPGTLPASPGALPASPALKHPDVPWHRLDVTDSAAFHALVAEVRPECVFHLAAILSARGEADPQRTYAVNQSGTVNLLEACRAHDVRQVLFTSTIAAYGPPLPEPVHDDVALRPTTMYGVTKVAGELLGAYYHGRYGLDFRAVRFPGLISAVPPGGGTSDYAPLMYYESLRTGAYEAFCRPDAAIPLMYMPDGLRALVELAAAPRARLTRCVYNIAAISPTAREIAADVARAVPGARITFKPDPARQAILDSWPRTLDDRLARHDWGWRPHYDLARMTDDLVPKLRALIQLHGPSGLIQLHA